MKNLSIYYLVLSFPILNIIAYVTTEYFSGPINPGVIRGVILMFFSAYFLLRKYPKHELTGFILVSLIYYLLLIPLSEQPIPSFYLYFKFFTATIMFPVGYYYFSTPDSFSQLIKVNYIVLVIILIDFVVSNVFGLGYSDYLEDSITFGIAGVNITKTIVPIIFSAPLYFYLNRLNRTHQYIIYTLILISFILVILGLKRSAILSLGFGTLITTLTYPQKTNLIKGVFGISLILLVTLPLYEETLSERYASRQESGHFDTEEIEENEGRIKEGDMVLQAFFDGNLAHKLIGSEFFNDRFFFNQSRMLHVDYFIMLNGSGLIGLFLFVGFYIYYYIRVLKYKSITSAQNKVLQGLFYSYSATLVVISLVLSIAGSVYSIVLRSTILLIMGSTLANMKKISVLSTKSTG